MNRKHPATNVFCYVLLLGGLQVASIDVAKAQGHRIPRPAAASFDSSQKPSEPTAAIQPGLGQTAADATNPAEAPASTAQDSNSNVASVPGKMLQANASVDLEEQQNLRYPETISNWESRKLRETLQSQTGTADGNAGSHRGLKAHVGGAVGKLGLVVGTVANAYVPVAAVRLTNAEPKIEIVPGHCPAAFDPAFQVPVRWWDILSSEEGNPVFGPQWKLWLSAVQAVFQSHARELKETPGVGSLHIMVNLDGSIFNISVYSGAERGNAGRAVNGRTLEHLRQIILAVGQLPAFPARSQVRCYHLIFNGSAGI